jgi:hypothetical protein
MTPIRVMLALVLVMIAVLLAAGCAAGEKQDLPPGKYIFLEHQIRTQGTTLAGDCSPVAYTDGPLYQFDEEQGTLLTVMSSGRVNESLILIYASGESETSSARTGGDGSAYPVYALPGIMWDNLTINSITPEGIMILHYQNTPITLKPKERWSVNTTPYIRNGCQGCNSSKCTEEIVTIDSIYNAGLFDKQKIKAQ